MKKNHLLIAILMLATTLLGQDSTKAHLRTVLSSDRIEYQVYEPIWVDLKIENIGTKMWIISRPVSSELLVYNSDGILMESCFRASSSLMEFEPGKVIETSCNITLGYGNLLDEQGFELALPAGQYLVKYNRSLSENVIWESVNLKIIIVEPSGDELKAKLLYELAKRFERRSEWAQADSTHKEILRQYPVTYYAEKSLQSRLAIYKFFIANRPERMSVAKELLERFTRHRMEERLVDTIIQLYERDNNLSGAKQYLDSLSQKTINIKLKSMLINKILPELLL